MFDLKKQEHSNLLQQANNINNKKYETSSANNTNGKHQSNNDLIHRQKSTSSTCSSMSSAANQLNSKNNNNLKNNLKHKHKTNSKQSKQARLLHNNNTNSNSSFGYEDDLDETNTTVTTVTTNQINNDTDLNSNSGNTNNEDYEDDLNYSDTTTTTNNQIDQLVSKKDEINDTNNCTSPTKKIRVNHDPVTSSSNLNKQSNSIYTPPKQTPQSQVFNSAASIIAETEAAAHRAALATLTNNFSMPPYIPPLNNQNQITNQQIQQQPHPVNFNIDSFNSFMLANLNNSKLSMPPPGPSTSNLMPINDQSQQQFIKLMVSVANCRKFILFLVLSKSNFYKKTSKPLLKIIPKLFILTNGYFCFYLYISYFIV